MPPGHRAPWALVHPVLCNSVASWSQLFYFTDEHTQLKDLGVAAYTATFPSVCSCWEVCPVHSGFP